MEELESQVAKIQIGNFKQSNGFVYILAEKAINGAEIYMVSELPLFNPAALESCERISLAIAGGLKRAYKRAVNDNLFESAVAQINDELGKLASLGQTNWIDRLNCIVAAKHDHVFYIATCGKVAAYLLRGQDITDISCSAAKSHPLKTFENVASGKIKLGDTLILSTAQLFNYLSLDRLKNILAEFPFLSAAQTLIEILKENAGPEVAFGTILNLQITPGEVPAEDLDLGNYLAETPADGQNFFTTTLDYIKSMFNPAAKKRVPQIGLPKISGTEKLDSLKKYGASTKQSAGKVWQIAKIAVGAAWRGIYKSKEALRPENIQGLSRQKKFFFGSAALLLLAVIINIAIAAHFKTLHKNQDQINSQLKEVQSLLANVQSSLLYKDETGARNYLLTAINKLPGNTKLTSAQQTLFTSLNSQIGGLKGTIDKIVSVDAVNLGGLGQADNLIKLPAFLAVQVGGNIISYNKQSGEFQDGLLKTSGSIKQLVYIKDSLAAIYNGQGLNVWNFDKGTNSETFSQNVPDQNSFVGLKFYPVNSRVYSVDKKTGQILNFQISDKVGKPVISTQAAYDFSKAQDLAIDGSIYVYNGSTISKFQSGSPMSFNLPALFTPLSGSGKIQTDKTFKNIYILDSGNKRVVIVDKKGNLVKILSSDKFSNPKDFEVNEAAKTIFILDNSSLLKINF